jgi:hypothetical protein
MNTRKEIHPLVDKLSEGKAEFVSEWLQDLRDANDEEGPPLDAEALASLDRGLADLAAGQLTHLVDYERERGL